MFRYALAFGGMIAVLCPALGAQAAEVLPEEGKSNEVMTREAIEAAEGSPDPLVRIRGFTAELARKDCLRSVALEGRAAAHLCAGQLDKALADIEDTIKAGGPVLTTYMLRGQVRFLQGEYKDALDDFARGGPEVEDLQPMVWAELCRMRMGAKWGNALAGALKQSELPEGDPSRERAKLFSGGGSADAYYDAVQKEIDKYQPPEEEQPGVEGSRKYSGKEREEMKDNHRRQRTAEAAFYIGEYYLAKGDRKEAGKWLERAADYQGLPDAWFLAVGRGAIAEQELKKLRADQARDKSPGATRGEATRAFPDLPGVGGAVYENIKRTCAQRWDLRNMRMDTFKVRADRGEYVIECDGMVDGELYRRVIRADAAGKWINDGMTKKAP